MDTATTSAKPGSGPDVRPIDPDHDIDTRKTVLSLAVVTVAVFAAVWLLLHLFNFVVFRERVKKFEEPPSPGLAELRVREAELLRAGEGRISIEDSMRELVERR